MAEKESLDQHHVSLPSVKSEMSAESQEGRLDASNKTIDILTRTCLAEAECMNQKDQVLVSTPNMVASGFWTASTLVYRKMASYDIYNWRETKPGVWQREADEIEAHHAAFVKAYEKSGGKALDCLFHASLTLPVPEVGDLEATSTLFFEALRIGWARLRHEMPTLASGVAYDMAEGKWMKTYRSIAGQDRRNIWLQQTVKTVSTGQTGTEWASTAPPTTEVATLFVIIPPQPSTSNINRDIVIRCGHDVIDGTGGLQVMDALLHHAAQAFDEGPGHILPVFDDAEVVRLSPPLRVAVGAPQQLTPELMERLKYLGTCSMKDATSPIEKATIPILRAGSFGEGKCRRIRHTFSVERTGKMIKALKSVGANPTHAFHSAIAMALRDFHGQVHPGTKDKQVQWYGHAIRSERSHCVPPYNTRAHSATVYYSGYGIGLPIVMPSLSPKDIKERNAEFSRILKEAGAFYRQCKEDKYHPVLAPFLIGNFMMKLNVPSKDDPLEWRRLNPMPKPDLKAGSSVFFSSLGVLDKSVDGQVGQIWVDDVWCEADHVNPDVGVSMGTFKGELFTLVGFNTAWHSEERAEEFLTRCEEIIFYWVDALEGIE
ncbi:hypothetical protein QBC38DRAFT_547843 [Podospora fimiseda]|uniref:Uncharacterized protein n=1 Tax=Podospora fimiseda TaxID=252190 RepID=A0AAN7BJ68_9PEZI|nr:hypothetical protein QBC38DRAFT_547843 [Podospora fimiseda]